MHLDNSGFKLEILEAAHNSCQSGKLSFWNCVIKHKDLEFIVGIDSDLLLELIRENTFINGVCQEQLMFIRKSGKLGMIHKEMTSYKDLEEDKQYKERLQAEAVKKLEPGRLYTSLNKSDIFICEVYQWFKLKEDYTILKKPIKMKLFLDRGKLEGIRKNIGEVESIGDLFERCADFSIRKYELLDNLIKSTPKRIAAEQVLKSDDFEEQFKRYQLSTGKHSRELYSEYLEEKNKNSRYLYGYINNILEASIRYYLSSYAITLSPIDFNRELVYKELVDLYSDSECRFILED